MLTPAERKALAQREAEQAAAIAHVTGAVAGWFAAKGGGIQSVIDAVAGLNEAEEQHGAVVVDTALASARAIEDAKRSDK